MDLWQLSIFCKVVETRSFSLAGKSVRLSQPTVSSHIKALEDYFGCRLIDRLAKEVLPTPAGKLLWEYARKLLLLRDETEAAMAAFQGSIRGQLRIGGSNIPGVYILPEIVGNFIRANPEVRIALNIGDTDSIIADILSGKSEMGIVGARSTEKKIEQEKLLSDRMFLMVPADHPWAEYGEIDAEMLAGEPFIIRESGSGTLKSVRSSLGKAGYAIEDLHIIAEMGSTGAVIQGIRNRLGISILSAIAVAEEIRNHIIRPLKIRGINLERNFYLSKCRNRTLSPLSEHFIRFLKKKL
ncbi:MAG: selenium metabolism-associated LysR family transcriptional regulator [Desulfococcaceae bacterium]|jgi:DNA-binding transcriptional LysR family regulator|nr:selenium metabolism-associated LysR family transcriptional regulator [Desulfococcaceae bacterium]